MSCVVRLVPIGRLPVEVKPQQTEVIRKAILIQVHPCEWLLLTAILVLPPSVLPHFLWLIPICIKARCAEDGFKPKVYLGKSTVSFGFKHAK